MEKLRKDKKEQDALAALSEMHYPTTLSLSMVDAN